MALCLGAAAIADEKELIDKVIAGITQNYSRLDGIEVIVETITVDPNVKEREVITGDMANGLKLALTRAPRWTTTTTILACGDNLRANSVPSRSNRPFFSRTESGRKYSPEIQRAWIRRPDQMPGMSPLDPREVAATDISERFADQLHNSKVIETHSVKSTDGRQVIEVLLEHTAGKREGMRYRCRFDRSMNFLPTKVEYLAKDGSVNLPMDITYQEVLPKAAWFMREAVVTFVSMQTMTIRTKGQVRIHQKIADEAFQIHLPAGTYVSDAVLGKAYRIK